MAYRQGDNPVGPVLDTLLPKHKHEEASHPAIHIADAARWMAALRRGEGMGHRALEFVALTAARSGEVRGARWDEIDLEAGMWTIPAERMKMSKPHRVPLSAPAVALLKSLPRQLRSPLVFFASRGGELSDMTLSKAMAELHKREVREGRPGFLDKTSGKPAVPHGLRSTFKDWATECTDYDNALSELALAHNVGNSVERAYRRRLWR
jgi:integrase